MENIVDKVEKGSIAEELEIEKGDMLLSINGSPVEDIIDYKFLLCDEEVVLEIKKPDGEVWELEIEKEYDEDLGITFENSIMDNAKSCCNHCVFCFVDQLPKGMRKTMYFKDDDSRLSFLQGNFVTLTNLTDKDIDRIIRYRISPINVSVHSTNPDLREKLLRNKSAGNIMIRLKKLKEAGIIMNCQIVLCPGLNDGEELKRTLNDLSALYPSIKNVAIVPVGVTKYREGLYDLETFNKESASKVIEEIHALNKSFMEKFNTPFARLSDEFYVMASKEKLAEVPSYEYYEDFAQIEDGIGMIRLFRSNIEDTLGNLNNKCQGKYLLVTGSSAYEEINNACELINEKAKAIGAANLNLSVLKIVNKFFGETITVAGLLTGRDILDAILKYKENEGINYVVIPENTLRNGEDIFLDDLTLKELEEKTALPIIVTSYTGEDLIEKINNNGKVI